jgi:hypothetical protein
VLSTVALLIVKRRAPSAHRTTLNTQLAKLLLFVMPLQAVAHLSMYALDVSLGVYQVPMLLGYWGFIAALVMVLFEPRIALATAAYWLSMLAALRWPEQRYLFGAAGNAGLFVNVLWLLHRRRRGLAAR